MSEQSLKERITEGMKDAMRAKDKTRLGTLRMILADLRRFEVDERTELDDARVVAILDKMVKQRRESVKQYEAAGRQDLADLEHAEISVIQEFLPEALGEAEIEQHVDAAISATGASGMQDMGAVMGHLKAQLQGRADMGQVSALVRKKLS